MSTAVFDAQGTEMQASYTTLGSLPTNPSLSSHVCRAEATIVSI